jgi:hypothetical protein
LNVVEDACQEFKTSYQAASLKYCNCDKCNGNIFKCEISGPTPAAEDTTTTAKITTTTTTTTTATTTTTIAITEEEGGDGKHGPTDENGGKSGEEGGNPNNAIRHQQQGIYNVSVTILALVMSLVACRWH